VQIFVRANLSKVSQHMLFQQLRQLVVLTSPTT